MCSTQMGNLLLKARHLKVTNPYILYSLHRLFPVTGQKNRVQTRMLINTIIKCHRRAALQYL